RRRVGACTSSVGMLICALPDVRRFAACRLLHSRSLAQTVRPVSPVAARTMALPAWEQFVSETPVDLIRLGLHFGVTQAQMSTVAFQELGKPLPAGITEQNVPPFP